MLSTKFISRTKEFCTFEKHIPAPYLRKVFILTCDCDDAEIVICGLGFYELFINGKKITKGRLAPYISNPDDIIYYDRYKVGAYLRKGENCIGILLGNGMLNSMGGATWDFDKAPFRSTPKVALSFTSSELCFEADESFKTYDSPILFDDLRCGEFYDARKECIGWSDVGYDDSSWQNAIVAERPRGKAVICTAEPIVNVREIKPVEILKAKDGFIYDFGENSSGVCRLNVDGVPGQEITLEHGELLWDGELYQGNLQFFPEGYKQKISYICNGDGCYTPYFTYFGFRYVHVKGIDEAQATEELLTYIVMNSDIKECGGFKCSDEVANRLQKMTRRSTMANFYYFPTDCPQREKNGWTGDAAVSAEHILLNVNAENSFKVWLENICAAQNSEGEIPGIIPTAGWGFGKGPAWDSVLVYLPYYTYLYRGDTEILENNAVAIFRYLNFLTTQMNEKGLVDKGLGDWCAAGRRYDAPSSPSVVTSSIIAMDICRKAAYIFEVVKKDLQRDFALKLFDRLRNSIRKYLLDKNDMTISGKCQTSQAMGIFYDVFEDCEKKQAFDMLLEFIERNNKIMDVGILGARVLFHVLSDFGHSDLAYYIITREDYPSYGTWVKRGLTTLCESFAPDGSKPSSLNHHMWGDISSWFIKHIGGININPYEQTPDEILISPKFIKKLSFADAFYIAPRGRVNTHWERQGDRISLEIEIPEGVSGKIVLENGYEFEDRLWEKPVKTGKYIIKEI